MGMGDEKDVIVKKMDGEFYQCDVCGYTDGFHTSFKKEGDRTEVYLSRPRCHR